MVYYYFLSFLMLCFHKFIVMSWICNIKSVKPYKWTHYLLIHSSSSSLYFFVAHSIIGSVFFLINLFIYFWLCWVFITACSLSLIAASRGYSSLWYAGFSLQWLLLLPSTGSRHTGFSSCGAKALELRLSSCGVWAQLLCSMWDLPRPHIEPVFPALAGGFLTTGHQGSPAS